MASRVYGRVGCVVDGCEAIHHVGGFCTSHYHRNRKHGHPLGGGKPKKRKLKARPPCTVEGCDRTRRASVYCTRHYQLVRQYGRTHNIYRARGTGHFNHQGYHASQVNGRAKFTHRTVMEEKLGRPLLPGEQVHHINGVRADNRPENLELWSTSQPCGQRVEDKLAWARQLIAQHEPAWIGGGC